MIDRKQIQCDIKKVLDVLEENGYFQGKLEIDFDQIKKVNKIQIHIFEKRNEKIFRITEIIKASPGSDNKEREPQK